MPKEILTILEELKQKKRKCQWRITQNQSSFYFDAEIKAAYENIALTSLEITFKGSGKQRLYLRDELTYKIEDDDKKYCCTIYTMDEGACLTFGYLKNQE